MTVCTYADGREYYRYNPPRDVRDAGLMIGITLGTDQESAFEQADELNAQIDNWRTGDIGVTNGVTLSGDTVKDLVEAYQASTFYADLNPKTKADYEACVKIVSTLTVDGHSILTLPFDSFTDQSVSSLYDDVATNIGSGTAYILVKTMVRLTNVAIKWRLMFQNPWATIEPEKAPAKPTVKASAEDVAAIYATAMSKPHWRAVGALVFAAADLGTTVSFLAAQPASYLDTERTKRLSDRTKTLLSVVLYEGDGPILIDSYGEALSNPYISKTFSRMREAAGVDRSVSMRSVIQYLRTMK